MAIVHDDASATLGGSVRGDTPLPGLLVINGLDTTGQTDVTAAIQARIDSVGNAAYNFMLPSGILKTSSRLLCKYDGQVLIGTGDYGTYINYVPTAHDGQAVLFAKDDGASSIWHCGIKNIRIRSTDSTYRKIAVEVRDARTFNMSDCSIGSPFLGGGASIGIRLAGREYITIKNTYVFTQDGIPFDIQTNPAAAIDQDYLRVENCVFSGDDTASSTQPCIRVASGVQMTRSAFRGINMSLGGAGFSWVDSTSTVSSDQLLLEQMGYEQSRSADGVGYAIKIDKTGGAVLNHLRIAGNLAGGDPFVINGLYLRNVSIASAIDVQFSTGGDTGLNISTVNRLVMQNCFEQSGATRTMTNMQPVVRFGRNIVSGVQSWALEVWETTANTNEGDSISFNEVYVRHRKVTLAAGASVVITTGGLVSGFFRVSAVGATISASGTAAVDNARATLLSGGAGSNFAASSTAGRLCIIYASSTAMTLHNQTAESLACQYSWEYERT